MPPTRWSLLRGSARQPTSRPPRSPGRPPRPRRGPGRSRSPATPRGPAGPPRAQGSSSGEHAAQARRGRGPHRRRSTRTHPPAPQRPGPWDGRERCRGHCRLPTSWPRPATRPRRRPPQVGVGAFVGRSAAPMPPRYQPVRRGMSRPRRPRRTGRVREVHRPGCGQASTTGIRRGAALPSRPPRPPTSRAPTVATAIDVAALPGR